MKEKLSEAYQSLYGEIVDKDIYHMMDVEDIVSINDPSFVHEPGHKRPFYFTPFCIIDLGANIGIFSRYARELFPNALIVAVEPDRNNCRMFQDMTFNDGWMILVNKAIGKGEVWHSKGAANGAGENYITEGIAYPKEQVINDNHYNPSNIQSVSLSDLIDEYIKNDEKFIVKIDIEANEQVVYGDENEMRALAKADYIAGEIHNFSLNGETNIIIRKKIIEALEFLKQTHTVEIKDLNFYATKR